MNIQQVLEKGVKIPTMGSGSIAKAKYPVIFLPWSDMYKFMFLTNFFLSFPAPILQKVSWWLTSYKGP